MTGGGNFNVPIPGATSLPDQKETSSFEDDISPEIVEAEASNAWTLMHRYNKAYDLLEKVVQVCPSHQLLASATQPNSQKAGSH